MTTLNLDNIDLGGFGVTDVKPEDKDKGFTGDQYSLDSHASSTMGEAFKTDAAQYSKNKQLSRDSGIPESAVAGDPAAVETNLKLKNIDFSEMSRRTPNTSKFLTDFNNAVVAQDDISAMQRVEDTLRSIPGGLVTGYGMAVEGAGRTAEAANRIAGRALSTVTPEALRPYLFETPETPDTLEAINEFANLISPAALLRSAGAGLKVSGEDIADVPQDRQNIATDIAGGVGQVAGQIAATILNPASALGMMFAQGVDQQGERQEESGTEGQSNVSDLALLTGGGITAVTEKIGIDVLMNRIPPKIKNKVLRQFADISLAGGAEALQEVVEGVAQGILEQVTTNPDAKILEGLDREAIAAGGTGAIVRGIINAITPGKVRSVQEADDSNIVQGQMDQVSLDHLNRDLGEMKMKQLDVETMRAFVEQVDNNDTHIFVDALQTSLFLQTKTEEEIAADPALKLMKDGIQEASITGTDVTIPFADFATELAGSTTFDDLREHMTMDPESVTPFRAEAAQEQTKNYIQELMVEAEQNVSQYVEAQEIFETVRQQLVDTGQVTPQNAKVMSEVVPAWATVYAKKNGITIQEAFDKSGLNITGPQTGERARLEGELEILKQGVPTEQVTAFTADGDVQVQAIQNVADAQGVTPAEVDESFKADVDQARWELQKQSPSELTKAIEEYATTNNVEPASVAADVYDNTGVAGQLFAQSETQKNLFVAHNLSSENILAAADLGGLAAPSLAVARSDISNFDGFGEVTLLADPSLLEDRKARTFDADVYTPRQPRATYKINEKKYNVWRKGVEADTEGLNLSIPWDQQLEEQTGADSMLRSDAVKYSWLKAQGKAPKLKQRKVESTIKAGAKLEGREFMLRDDPKLIKLAEKHYRNKINDIVEKSAERAERFEDMYFNEDGTVKTSKINDFAQEVVRFRDSGGKDLNQLRHSISDKFRNAKLREQFEQEVTKDFNALVDGKTIFKGFTDSGNRRYTEYNISNVVREMTQSLQGGETHFYGVANVRSAHANEMKTIAQVQARRDQIIPEADLAVLKEDSASVFENALEDLKPFYKFDADNWGYAEDAGTAIMQGPKAISETFNVTPEVKKIIDDLTEYLSALPSTYFEAKVQRAVGFDEFNTAVVPRGMNKDALHVLKDAGLTIKTYNPKEEGARAAIIAKQKKLLFQEDDKGARGYFDPSNSMIRLTEAADLSTFLHEFAHFMYEMEIKAGGDTATSINNWYKRNRNDVAAEANTYLTKRGDLEQSAFHGTPHQFDKFSLDAIGTGEGAQAYGWGLYFAGKKSIAEFYRDAISGFSWSSNIQSLLKTNVEGMDDTTARLISKEVISNNSETADYIYNESLDYAGIDSEFMTANKDEVINAILETKSLQNEGQLFEVDIPEDSELLNYDAPLDAQGDFTTAIREITDAQHGDGTFEAYVENNEGGDFKDWSDNLMEDVTEQDISMMLNDKGIKGLRYLDADSRIGDADGNTSNYVIWDEQVVTVKSVNDELREAEQFAQSPMSQDVKTVYHGGTLDADDRQSNGLVFAATDKAQAEFYASQNDGVMNEIEVNESEIMTDDDAIDLISELGIKPLDESWSVDESSVYELLDPQFDQFIGDDNVQKLKEALKERGMSAISFFDEDVTPAGTGRQTAENIVILNPKAEQFAQSPEIPGADAGSITSDDVVNYIDNTTTGDRDKDSAIRRALHEQFARGFETYLMEGKAPSLELRNAFRTFARWMVEIYKSVRGQLNVNLDDEMRQVLDRMLATEEQIAAANARGKHTAMFKDAEVAEMTAKQFKSYNDQIEKVEDVETETLRDKLIKEITRTTKAWWKTEKSDIIDEQLDTLKKEKVYIAAATLKAPAASNKDNEDKIKQIDKDIADLEKQIKKLTKDNDTIGKFISKAGGLNREAMEADGVDPANFKNRGKAFGKPLFPAKGGLTSDDVAELLNEEGYDLDANEALDLIMEMLDDDNTFVDSEVDVEIANIDDQISNLDSEKDTTEGVIATSNIKMDLATVKDMVGFERTDSLKRTSRVIPPALTGMTATGQDGVHPDIAAAMLGYSSGSELINDLMNATPINQVAEQNAEAIMLERHGDIMNDGTIEQEANDAVHNEERGKLILHELKALRRGTNQPTLDRAEIKAYAEDTISQLTYRTLFPAKYRKAEIAAAQESAAALATGDKEKAATAKARQVLNYYLGNAATEARAKTEKIVDNMSRYNKKKVREEIQKADGGYWEQVVKILNRFEFRKTATLKSVDVKNMPVGEWVAERLETNGDQLIMSDAVLDETYTVHWKNIPFDTLLGVNDSVKNIEHVARYGNKMNHLGEKVEFEKIVATWNNHMNQQPSVFKPQRTTTTEGKNWVRAGMAQMTKIPFMASWLDGGERVGLSHELLMDGLNKAGKEEQVLWKQTGAKITEAIINRSKKDIKRHMTNIFIPEIKDANNDGNLIGSQVVAVALNTGNAGNLRKMLLGEGWADPEVDTDISLNNPQLQAVLKHMTKDDWELVQNIWDQMEALYKPLAEVHRRTTGIVPPQVEAVSFTNEYGTFRGGYYPVVYDHHRSGAAAINKDRADAQTDSMFGGMMSLHASVTAGATNERTGYYGPMNLNLDVVPNHFQETIHFITHHDAVRQLNRLITDTRIRETIIGKLGQDEYSQLKPWLNDMAKEGAAAPPKTFIDAAFGQLRSGVTLGVMGFKASTGIIQLSGIFNTYAEIGPKHVHKAMSTVYGRGISSIKDATAFAFEHSNIMETRTQTMDREIKNVLNSMSENKQLKFVQEASMKHIALIQFYGADILTWHAGYTSKLEETGDLEKAYKYADWAVENIQGSGATKDMAGLMRSQSKLHSTFTMFMTFFSSLWNMERDLVRGGKSGRYSSTTIAAKSMFLFTLPVLFEMMMRGELFGEDDEPEEQAQKVLTKLALFPIASVPFVRDIASGIGSQYGYNSSPVASMLEQGLQGTKGLLNAAIDGELSTFSQAKSTAKLAGAAFKIPGIGQAFATGEHIYDVVEEGEDFTMHQLLFGPKKD